MLTWTDTDRSLSAAHHDRHRCRLYTLRPANSPKPRAILTVDDWPVDFAPPALSRCDRLVDPRNRRELYARFWRNGLGWAVIVSTMFVLGYALGVALGV